MEQVWGLPLNVGPTAFGEKNVYYICDIVS
jgi:hypothetical protein